MSVLTSGILCSLYVFYNSRVAPSSLPTYSSMISFKFGIKLYFSNIVCSWIGFRVLKRNEKVLRL